MNRVILAFILFITIQSAYALELECPKSIKTNQSLSNPVSGWSEAIEENTHNLKSKHLSWGHPSGRAFLRPEVKSDGTNSISTWVFKNSSDNYYSCFYHNTSVVLTKQLPEGLKKCTARFNKHKHIKGNIYCE